MTPNADVGDNEVVVSEMFGLDLPRSMLQIGVRVVRLHHDRDGKEVCLFGRTVVLQDNIIDTCTTNHLQVCDDCVGDVASHFG
jgi:hypothetical protein